MRSVHSTNERIALADLESLAGLVRAAIVRLAEERG